MYCGVSMYSVSPNWIYRYTCTCVCISVYVYVYICVRVNILWRRPCVLYRQIESMVIHGYVYVYTCVCVCTCIEEKPMYSVTANWIYEDKWECICICIYIYIYIHICMYICTYTCTYVYVNTKTYICIYANILWRPPCVLYRQTESISVYFMYVHICICMRYIYMHIV